MSGSENVKHFAMEIKDSKDKKKSKEIEGAFEWHVYAMLALWGKRHVCLTTLGLSGVWGKTSLGSLIRSDPRSGYVYFIFFTL